MCTRLDANYYLPGREELGTWGGHNDLIIYCCHCGFFVKRNLTPFGTMDGGRLLFTKPANKNSPILV